MIYFLNKKANLIKNKIISCFQRRLKISNKNKYFSSWEKKGMMEISAVAGKLSLGATNRIKNRKENEYVKNLRLSSNFRFLSDPAFAGNRRRAWGRENQQWPEKCAGCVHPSERTIRADRGCSRKRLGLRIRNHNAAVRLLGIHPSFNRSRAQVLQWLRSACRM